MSLYDDFERIAFPLIGDNDNAVPEDVLVDCLVHAPASYGDLLTLISISVTSLGLVSCVFALAGQPVAYCTRVNPTVHDPIPLTGIRPGVSGFVAFGSGIARQRIRVDGDYRLEDRCLVRYHDHLAGPTVQVGGHPFVGLVRLNAGAGLTITPKTLTVKLEDASLVTQVVGLIGTAPAVGTEPIPGCRRPSDGAAEVSPIRQINDVVPSCAGDITLQVVNVRQTPDQPGLQVVPAAGKIVLEDEGQPCAS